MSLVTCLNCRLVVPHPVWSAAILNFPIVCVTTCRLVIPHPVWFAAESRIACVHVVVVWSYHTRCGPLLSHILRVTCYKLSFGHAVPGVVRLYGTYCLFNSPPPPSPLLSSPFVFPSSPFPPPFFPPLPPPLRFSYCPCLHVTYYMLHVNVQLPSRAGSTLGCGQVRGGALVVVGSLAPLIFSHLAAIAAEFLQQSGVTAW